MYTKNSLKKNIYKTLSGKKLKHLTGKLPADGFRTVGKMCKPKPSSEMELPR